MVMTRSAVCASDVHFVPSRSTGKERDTESGNDYFDARYYSSAMGRFLSPDWSAKVEPVPYAKLDNPQSLNLYAYVGNNPLSRTDPDGHCDSSGTATANTKCQDVSNLHVNDAMKQHIKMTEGLSADPRKGIKQGDPALTVYPDKAGNPTVGWGHKITAGEQSQARRHHRFKASPEVLRQRSQ